MQEWFLKGRVQYKSIIYHTRCDNNEYSSNIINWYSFSFIIWCTTFHLDYYYSSVSLFSFFLLYWDYHSTSDHVMIPAYDYSWDKEYWNEEFSLDIIVHICSYAFDILFLSGCPWWSAIANGFRLNSVPICWRLQLVIVAYLISVASPELHSITIPFFLFPSPIYAKPSGELRTLWMASSIDSGRPHSYNEWMREGREGREK